jgi:threonine/homoserine/homoserine lactone efflux protein
MGYLEFLPYVVALGIASAIPGPGITGAVGTALGAGFEKGLYFVTGIVIGDLAYLGFAVLGLTAIAAAYGEVFVVIKLAGAAYLLFLAYNFWRGGVDPQTVAARGHRGRFSTFLGGLTLTLGNPKTIIFYLALLPTVVDLNAVSARDFAGLALLTIGVLYTVCIPYIGLAAKARTFLTNPRALKWLGRGAASAMAGAALFVVVKE